MVESELELRFSDSSAVFFHIVSIKDSKEQELANRIKDTKTLYRPESYPLRTWEGSGAESKYGG